MFSLLYSKWMDKTSKTRYNKIYMNLSLDPPYFFIYDDTIVFETLLILFHSWIDCLKIQHTEKFSGYICI
jgi:hypothetical protein